MTTFGSRVDRICKAVAEFYGLSVQDLGSLSRKRLVGEARRVAMHILRESTSMTLPEIGATFCRHHTTVIYSLGVVERALANNPFFARDVAIIKTHITQ